MNKDTKQTIAILFVLLLICGILLFIYLLLPSPNLPSPEWDARIYCSSHFNVLDCHEASSNLMEDTGFEGVCCPVIIDDDAPYDPPSKIAITDDEFATCVYYKESCLSN